MPDISKVNSSSHSNFNRTTIEDCKIKESDSLGSDNDWSTSGDESDEKNLLPCARKTNKDVKNPPQPVGKGEDQNS